MFFGGKQNTCPLVLFAFCIISGDTDVDCIGSLCAYRIANGLFLTVFTEVITVPDIWITDPIFNNFDGDNPIW